MRRTTVGKVRVRMDERASHLMARVSGELRLNALVRLSTILSTVDLWVAF